MINELDNTISVLEYDTQGFSSELELLQTVSTLPEGWEASDPPKPFGFYDRVRASVRLKSSLRLGLPLFPPASLPPFPSFYLCVCARARVCVCACAWMRECASE